MSDVYKAPSSSVTQTSPETFTNSIEDATSGNYRFDFSETFAEARQRCEGYKLKINIIFFIYFLVILAALLISGMIGLIDPENTAFAALSQIVYIVATLPLGVGILMIGLERAIGEEPRQGQLFAYYGKILPLTLTYILMIILIMLGFLLFVLPGIYLATAYMFAMALVVDKNMGVWEALETSRKTISKNWFKFFGFWLFMILINIIGMIPLGIGLFWTVPWTLLGMAIIYRNMFGYQSRYAH